MIELNKTDINNLLSIINNTTFKGLEAETIVELKKKLVVLSEKDE